MCLEAESAQLTRDLVTPDDLDTDLQTTDDRCHGDSDVSCHDDDDSKQIMAVTSRDQDTANQNAPDNDDADQSESSSHGDSDSDNDSGGIIETGYQVDLGDDHLTGQGDIVGQSGREMGVASSEGDFDMRDQGDLDIDHVTYQGDIEGQSGRDMGVASSEGDLAVECQGQTDDEVVVSMETGRGYHGDGWHGDSDVETLQPVMSETWQV